MKVLILSCSTGQGHNAVSQAIAQQFHTRGTHCEVVDSLQFISNRTARFLSWGHSFMYCHLPKLFRTGYGAAERHTSIWEEGSAVYRFFAKGAQDLRDYCVENCFTHVICAHIFSALMMTEAKRWMSSSVQTYFVGTDYTCYPGIQDSKLDLYFIPDASLAADFVGKQTMAVGIPLRQEFYQRRDRAVAKQKADIPPDQLHVLMMCGSMGCGPMEKLAELIAQRMGPGCELSVVCGKNRSLYEKLIQAHGHMPNVHIHGFVDNIPELMDSADVYVTKPGGISTTEAMAKGLPMVLVDAVAGCEEHNMRFFVQMGAAVGAKDPRRIAVHCLRLLRNEKKRAAMEQVLLENSKNGAKEICDHILGTTAPSGAAMPISTTVKS